MKRDKVLLVGNGINNIASEYKWGDLVDDLVEFVNANDRIKKGNKPFPLLYEEIVAHAVKERGKKESQIKKYIADRIAAFQPNDVHRRIVSMKLAGLLTTNYDYTLELAAGIDDQRALVNSGVIQEKHFSLFRFVKAKKARVWHIHGERNVPGSIALGYEHYSGYLQRMRNYVVSGTGESYAKQFEPLEKSVRKGTISFDSWIDFFFVHDVYIVGLNLDFVEMHLWWLLTYRARRKYVAGLPIQNRITYFYPNSMGSKIRDKLELLQANDVVPVSIPLKAKNWVAYYSRVLEQIGRD